jgi:hypothetical protein
MAKSDSFFIRASVTTDSTNFAKAEIDLGSFVNLGVSKSTLLRIHQIDVQYADATDVGGNIYYDAAVGGSTILWQLTTQDQTALVYADDKSVAATGAFRMWVDPTSTAHVSCVSEKTDMNPSDFTNGMLIGVDSLFLGTKASATPDSGDVKISLVIECTLENATQANSVALALSQQ